MRIKNDPRSWTFQLLVSAVMVFVMSLPMSWILGMQWRSLFIVLEAVSCIVSAAISMLVVHWCKEGVEHIIENENIDWEAFSNESIGERFSWSYEGQRLYHPIDVPQYGPWIAILGLGTIIALAFSILSSLILTVSLWKVVIAVVPTALLVAWLSGVYTFMWVRETRQKLLRNSN